MNYQSCTTRCSVKKLNPFLRPNRRKNCEQCWLDFMHEFGHFPTIPAVGKARALTVVDVAGYRSN